MRMKQAKCAACKRRAATGATGGGGEKRGSQYQARSRWRGDSGGGLAVLARGDILREAVAGVARQQMIGERIGFGGG